MGLTERRLRGFNIFWLSKETGEKKEDGVRHHLENFLMLLHFKGFSYCCLRNSESSRNPIKHILVSHLKLFFGELINQEEL